MKKYGMLMGMLFSAFTSTLFGQMSWQGTAGVPGNWTDTANWSGGVVPDLSNYSYLNNGGIAVIDSPAGVSSIRVNSEKLEIQSGGKLDVKTCMVGESSGSDGYLEIDGGELTYTNDLGGALYIGYYSGSTGKVTMLSGSLTVDQLRIGWQGNGMFVLSNGTVTANSGHMYFTGMGLEKNSNGTFIQEGGTFNFSNGTFQVGRATGSRCLYVLNDGLLNTPDVLTGVNSGSYGEAQFNGGTFEGGVYAGSCDNGTGVVSFVNFTNNLDQLRVNCQPAAGGGSARTNSTAILTITDSVVTNLAVGGHDTCIGFGDSSAATVVQDNSLVYWNSGITVGETANATATYTVTNGAVLRSAGYGTQIGRDGSGRLNIHGGDVYTEGASLYIGDNGTGVVDITEGSLTVSGLRFPNGTGSGILNLKGGVFKSQYKKNVSWQFYIGGTSDEKGYGSFIQSGGVFVVDTNANYCSLGYGCYEISGGSLASTNVTLQIQTLTMPDVGTFRVKGSAGQIDVKSIAGGSDPFFLEYIMDKSGEHIAPINFYYDRASRCGHLRIGFDGGVMLSDKNTFTLISWVDLSTSASYGDYLSTPDASMWTETLYTSNPSHDDITLADGYKMGSLDLDGTTSAQFAERSMGHVTVENLSTNKLVNLVMRLAVTEEDKNLSELVDDLVDAGYTNSVAETSGIYNLKVVIPAEYVIDSSEAATSYFAWDFTDTTTGTTNATVTAIEVLEENLPPTGTLLMIL